VNLLRLCSFSCAEPAQCSVASACSMIRRLPDTAGLKKALGGAGGDINANGHALFLGLAALRLGRAWTVTFPWRNHDTRTNMIR